MSLNPERDRLMEHEAGKANWKRWALPERARVGEVDTMPCEPRVGILGAGRGGGPLNLVVLGAFANREPGDPG